MKKISLFFTVILLISVITLTTGCDSVPSSDEVQQTRQEEILKEIAEELGLPGVKNFREMRILKELYELRDQEGLSTYTYTFSAFTMQYFFHGESIGYGIPYSTQYSNPQKVEKSSSTYGYLVLPQAEPNGLFPPASAEGTWVMMLDHTDEVVRPQYIEERICVFTFKRDPSEVSNY